MGEEVISLRVAKCEVLLYPTVLVFFFFFCDFSLENALPGRVMAVCPLDF